MEEPVSRKSSIDDQSAKIKKEKRMKKHDDKRDKSPSSEKAKSRKNSSEQDNIEITFKKCPSYKSSSNSRKSSVEESEKDSLKRKSSPISKENLLYGTSSSSENEHKKLSPDRKSSSEKSPLRSPKHLQEEDVSKTLKKMSPSSRDKRVSFESKEEKEKKDETVVEKEREDSLPPPDFEENYLIAQSDILRQASIEYDRRMQEHKEMLQRMRAEDHFDESTSQEFPDFETWMEEREKEESRKSSLEKCEAEEKRVVQETSKPYSIANLRDEVLIEVSVEGSFDSVDKHSEDEPQHLIVHADVEPVPCDNEEPVLPEIPPNEPQSKTQDTVKKYTDIYTRIREIVMVEYLKQTEMCLKADDLKAELVKQDSIKEMRRSLERKFLRNAEPNVERRRRSEEKSPVTSKHRAARQRRSLSFDEEILI